MSKGPSEALLLSVTQAAQALAIGRSTMYELLASGEIAYVRIRSHRYVRRATLEAFIEKREVRKKTNHAA